MSGSSAREWEERMLVLRRFEVADIVLELEVPRDPAEQLEKVDSEAFARDERMPYWCEMWPAARGLAIDLARRSDLGGKRVLELGCGLALPGFCAAHCGATVLATDYFAEALDLARRNAERLGLEVRTAFLDWREPEPLEGFDLVIGADLLYEDRNIDPLVRLLAVDLCAPAEIVIADPGRRGAALLEDRLGGFGIDFETDHQLVCIDSRFHDIRLHRCLRTGTEAAR